jgi:hypothetical protein
MSAVWYLRIGSRQRRRRSVSMRSESATGFLRVPARRLVRQVCGRVAAPSMTEAAAYSRSPRFAGRADGASAAPRLTGLRDRPGAASHPRGHRAAIRIRDRRTR